MLKATCSHTYFLKYLEAVEATCSLKYVQVPQNGVIYTQLKAVLEVTHTFTSI